MKSAPKPPAPDPKKDDALAHSMEELTQRNVETICRLEAAAQREGNLGEKIADRITSFCGSITFAGMHVAWFITWILTNTIAPDKFRFDPYPFQFLTFVVSLEAILLSTFILISQKRQSRLDEQRAGLDLQVDLLAEQENTKMLELLSAIARQVGVSQKNDPTLKVLEQATRPEILIHQIEKTKKNEKT